MPRAAWPLLVVAWVALLFPWERCHGECHDQLVPLGSEHGCHGDECPDEPEDHGDEDARHEAVSTVLLSPDAPPDAPDPGLVRIVPIPDAAAGARAPNDPAADPHPPFFHDDSTVLLL
jgi:hypothetical protein